jgi:hypothetical protein
MRIQHEYLKQATPVFTKLRIRPCLRISCHQIHAASIRMQTPIAICRLELRSGPQRRTLLVLQVIKGSFNSSGVTPLSQPD